MRHLERTHGIYIMAPFQVVRKYKNYLVWILYICGENAYIETIVRCQAARAVSAEYMDPRSDTALCGPCAVLLATSE